MGNAYTITDIDTIFITQETKEKSNGTIKGRVVWRAAVQLAPPF